MGEVAPFTDPDGVTYYQARAARLWNGETLKVQADGTICGLTPGTLSSPAEFYVQTVDTGCGRLGHHDLRWAGI
jgi:hypothetical protein